MSLALTSTLMVVLVARRNVAKHAMALEGKKSVNAFLILEGKRPSMGTLEKERNKTRKLLTERR